MQRFLLNIVFDDRAFVIAKLQELAELFKAEPALMNTFTNGDGQHGHCIIREEHEKPSKPILDYKDV